MADSHRGLWTHSLTATVMLRTSTGFPHPLVCLRQSSRGTRCANMVAYRKSANVAVISGTLSLLSYYVHRGVSICSRFTFTKFDGIFFGL